MFQSFFVTGSSCDRHVLVSLCDGEISRQRCLSLVVTGVLVTDMSQSLFVTGTRGVRDRDASVSLCDTSYRDRDVSFSLCDGELSRQRCFSLSL